MFRTDKYFPWTGSILRGGTGRVSLAVAPTVHGGILGLALRISNMYERVLLATDGSDYATKAAEHAVHTAEREGARLHVLYVIETRTGFDNAILNPEEIRSNLREIGEEALDAVEERAAASGVEIVTSIEEGIPAETIHAYVETNDIDLVFVGERGHSDFKTVLLGSTTEQLIHTVDVPVTVV